MSAEAALQDWIDRSFSAALAGDSPQWDALVRELSLTPLTPPQRSAIRSAGVPKLPRPGSVTD